MCGIAGFILSDSVTDPSNLLRSMADIIAYRGPDDEGFYKTHSCSSEYSVGLAHRRLSIIDLNTGHQPIGNEDGSIQIVFNGEIYNFKSLRDKLITRGHRFRTSSDTETIVHAYEEYGEACVEQFRGMFAFAIWDAVNERLFLARDRFGKKPLYIHEQDSSLLFASEIKSLLQYPGITPRVNSVGCLGIPFLSICTRPKNPVQEYRETPPRLLRRLGKGTGAEVVVLPSARLRQTNRVGCAFRSCRSFPR